MMLSWKELLSLSSLLTACSVSTRSPVAFATYNILLSVQTKYCPELEREHFIYNKHQDFSINEVMATSSGLAGTLTETTVSREENTTLKLKLTKKKQTKKIQWTEDTVDNEGIETY